MNIKKIITPSEIPAILDKSLQDYKEHGTLSNIMFVGKEGYGKRRTVDKWLKEKGLNSETYWDLTSLPMYSLTKGQGKYGFADDVLETLSIKKVLFEREIYNRPEKGLFELAKLIKNRCYTGYFGKKYDFEELFLVVATARMRKESNPFCDLFDIYQVETTVNEVSLYLIDYYNNEKKIAAFRLKQYEEDYDEYVKYREKFPGMSIEQSVELKQRMLKQDENAIKILEKLVGVNEAFDQISPRRFKRMLESVGKEGGTPEDFYNSLINENSKDVKRYGCETSEKTEQFFAAIKKALLDKQE